jgi:hypothetical protein
MTIVEQDALSLGYQKFIDKKGDVNGIARRMPTITQLISQTLDEEPAYRLLSAVAHGHLGNTANQFPSY